MTGRPDKSEAAAHYFAYIDQVAGDDPQAALENQLENAIELLSTISEPTSQHRYQPDKWSIRQLLNHVTDTERAFVFRAMWFARGFEEALPGYDQEIAASGAEADTIAWAAHVEEFRRVRLATMSFFANLPPNAWMKTGKASGYPFTVRALAFIAAGHAVHHFRILRERYL